MGDAIQNETESTPTRAWLEDKRGEKLPLTSPFEFGRSPACACQIRRVEASRVHAMLQFDPVREIWWLSDLGSQNGTYLNGRRIKSSEAMAGGDTITICSETFTFREKKSGEETTFEAMHSLGGATLVTTSDAECWLLLVDIMGSTALSRVTPQDEYSRMLRDWMKSAAEIITRNGGVVNEYLGDAIYAFWRTGEDNDLKQQVSDALVAFREYREVSPFKFRVLIHHGLVQIGGGMSSGLESLVGPQVNFFFKSEKVIGAQPVFSGLSFAAAAKLGDAFPTRSLGTHAIPGFPGEHEFFTGE